MSITELNKFKSRVDKYGRGKLAREINMPYGTISGKVNGYIEITEEEIKKINSIIGEARNCAASH